MLARSLGCCLFFLSVTTKAIFTPVQSANTAVSISFVASSGRFFTDSLVEENSLAAFFSRFRFFGSSVRREDGAGTLLDFWAPDELQELAQIEATLPAEGRAAGDVVPVQLRARVTEIGTLELLAEAAGGGQWKVEFDVRENTAG